MSLWKAITGLISDTVARTARLDASTHTLQVINYNHHEIHAGSHYFVEDVADLTIDDVFDVQWISPDSTKWSHFTFVLSCESETEWYIYEGVSISVTGTALTPRNNNRNSGNTSNVVMYSISNTSEANANSDTPTAGATAIAHGIVGAGRDGGVGDRTREIVFEQATIYCLRAIANTAGYINFLMKWYEHTDKD